MENLSQTPSNQPKAMLPNATAVLVLGICSIVFGCLFVGLILGIIGLVLGNKSRKLYKENPAIWEGYNQLNAGWIMSIIGLAISALYTIYYIFWIVIFGAAAASFWNMSQM
jgi:hypothetical protein